MPGSKGGGAHQSSELGTRPESDATKRAADTPTEPSDPAVVTAPQEKPSDWPPKEGIRILLRGPQGEQAAGWRLGVGDGGPEDGRPASGGVLQTRDKRIVQEGFRIRAKAGLLRHRAVPAQTAVWVVHLPGSPLPTQRQAAPIELLVRDEGTGAPVPGAEITWSVAGKDRRAQSDASGRAQLRGGHAGLLLRATVDVKDRKRRSLWLSPRDPRPQVVELDRDVSVETELVFPPDAAGLGVVARLLDAGGQSLPEGEVKRLSNERFKITLPRSRLDTAWLEFQVRHQRHGSSAFRHPLKDLPARLEGPAFRVVKVSVRDVHGEPALEAILTQDCQTCAQQGEAVEPQRFLGASLQKSDGTYETIVPEDRPFTLLVESPGHAPMARRFQAGDGNEPLQFIAETGLEVPVLVLDAAGQPLRGANVMARASLQGMRVLRAGTTDASGRAGLGPFPPGPVEIFARGAGHAWAAAVTEAAAGQGTVRLELVRGHPLTLVVEDAFGLPLEGVAVELTPSGGGLPLVSPPTGGAHNTTAEGTLTLPALPNHLYDVTLTRTGYHIEKLRKLRPGAVTYYATMVRK